MTDNAIQATPPDWVCDAVFYQIFPDRFFRSGRVYGGMPLEPWDAPPTYTGFKGGDFDGITRKLDHLQRLGINAIYLNPIFQSAANHRYHTHDYFQVDPILGGNQAFQRFLAAAHDRHMRVILDGVFNHASRGFFQFNHILENGPASPYENWFHIHGYPLNAYSRKKKAGYEAWFGLPALPKFNTNNPAVREFLMTAGEHWIRAGIDGWRLDVPLEIKTPGFWEAFRQRCRAINPDAYLVAEIWDDATPWLQGAHFDAAMNYRLHRACLGFFGGPKLKTRIRLGPFTLSRLTGTAFEKAINELVTGLPWPVTLSQFNLLGSHDTHRFINMVSHDTVRFKMAALFLMAFPGAPCLYYGDEIGMQGGRDPDCRRGMIWDRERWDMDLFNWIRQCIQLRHEHACLRRGAFQAIHADETTYAFLRHHKGKALLLAFNIGSQVTSFDILLTNLPFHPTHIATVFPQSSQQQKHVAPGRLSITLNALSCKVFSIKEE